MSAEILYIIKILDWWKLVWSVRVLYDSLHIIGSEGKAYLAVVYHA